MWIGLLANVWCSHHREFRWKKYATGSFTLILAQFDVSGILYNCTYKPTRFYRRPPTVYHTLLVYMNDICQLSMKYFVFPCDYISKAKLNYHGKIHPQSATKSGIVFTVSGDRLSGCRLFETSGFSQNGKTDQYLVHVIPVSIYIGHVHALFKVRIICSSGNCNYVQIVGHNHHSKRQLQFTTDPSKNDLQSCVRSDIPVTFLSTVDSAFLNCNILSTQPSPSNRKYSTLSFTQHKQQSILL